MRNFLVKWSTAAVLAVSSASASAVLITESPYIGTNAGDIDSLLGYGNAVGGGANNEVAFKNALTGESYTLANTEKLCEGTDCDSILYATDVAGAYGIYLPDQPEYFLLKTGAGSWLSGGTTGFGCVSGGGGNDDCTHFLFSNVADSLWGVFDFAWLGFPSTTSITKIGHIVQAGTTQVPEPNSILLLGTGFFGLGVLRRRRPVAQ